MKLIMENWRHYSQSEEENTIFLFEHNVPYKVDFGSILEQKELDQAIKLWEVSSNYELENLLFELKMMDKVKEFTSKIGEKVNEFILKLSNHAFLLLQKGAQAAKSVISVVKKITDTVSAYCNKIPTICKIAKASATIIAMFAISALFFSPEAQAAIQIGEQPLDTDSYNFLRGFFFDTLQHSTTDAASALADRAADWVNIIEELDALQASPEVDKYEDLAPHLQQALESGSDWYHSLAEFEETGKLSDRRFNEIIKWYVKLGETASATIDTIVGEGSRSTRLQLDLPDVGPRPF